MRSSQTKFWRSLLYRRPADIHKGRCGHALLIGGSPGLTGALSLAAQAALRAGAGLVTAGVPDELNNIFEGKLTEVMTLPLDSYRGVLVEKSFSKIKSFIAARKIAVLAVGPGLSRAASSYSLVKKILQETSLPVIMDADALNLASRDLKLLNRARAQLILTPHLGEFSRLIKRSVESVIKDRKELAKDFSLRYNLILVLKGHRTIITDGLKVVENKTGNPGLATAGSGDVLTGILTGLVAQAVTGEKSPEEIRNVLFEAAQFGARLHGLAADIAVRKTTQASLIASDVLDFFPAAVKEIFK